MGNAFSDCYESPDSNHPPPNDTGRSDLYHASWDPSEAGKYHTDSTRKADPEYNLEADDEAEKDSRRQPQQERHEKDKDISDPSAQSAGDLTAKAIGNTNAEGTSAGSHRAAVTESHIAKVSTARHNRCDDEEPESLNQSDNNSKHRESTAPGETGTRNASK